MFEDLKNVMKVVGIHNIMTFTDAILTVAEGYKVPIAPNDITALEKTLVVIKALTS
jgi:hypothetical protein